MRPLRVRGCWGFFGIGRLVLGFGEDVMCGRRDVWIPEGIARFFGVVVIALDSVLAVSRCCGVERIDEAPSTDPPHDTRISSSVSWVLSEKTDRSNANFTSVDSSSDVDAGAGGVDGCGERSNRGFFRETNASIGRAASSMGKPSRGMLNMHWYSRGGEMGID